MGIKEEMVQDRCAWRNITRVPARASGDAWHNHVCLGSRTLNAYDDDDDRFNEIWIFSIFAAHHNAFDVTDDVTGVAEQSRYGVISKRTCI